MGEPTSESIPPMNSNSDGQADYSICADHLIGTTPDDSSCQRRNFHRRRRRRRRRTWTQSFASLVIADSEKVNLVSRQRPPTSAPRSTLVALTFVCLTMFFLLMATTTTIQLNAAATITSGHRSANISAINPVESSTSEMPIPSSKPSSLLPASQIRHLKRRRHSSSSHNEPIESALEPADGSNLTNKPLVVLPDDYDSESEGDVSLSSSSSSSSSSSTSSDETTLTRSEQPDQVTSSPVRQVQESSGELEELPSSSNAAESSSKYIEHNLGANSINSASSANESFRINQHEPLNGELISSFFSHIDKQWKFAEIILIIVISLILNLVTIIGNIMVLISFKMDRSLQTVSNYFLLSLALADLLIGLISMPLYTLYLLLNYWPLGSLMCDIWLAIDYLNSNAAVLNMLIISFDRYFSVTRPLTYRAKRTTKHAILMISCAWILSLTIWTPAIFTYPYYKGRTVQGTDKCEIEFVKANTYLTFVTAILAFYIPVIIMIYLYWRIWLETKKRYRDLTTLFLVSGVGAAAPARGKQQQLQQQQQHQVAGNNSCSFIIGHQQSSKPAHHLQSAPSGSGQHISAQSRMAANRSPPVGCRQQNLLALPGPQSRCHSPSVSLTGETGETDNRKEQPNKKQTEQLEPSDQQTRSGDFRTTSQISEDNTNSPERRLTGNSNPNCNGNNIPGNKLRPTCCCGPVSPTPATRNSKSCLGCSRVMKKSPRSSLKYKVTNCNCHLASSNENLLSQHHFSSNIINCSAGCQLGAKSQKISPTRATIIMSVDSLVAEADLDLKSRQANEPAGHIDLSPNGRHSRSRRTGGHGHHHYSHGHHNHSHSHAHHHHGHCTSQSAGHGHHTHNHHNHHHHHHHHNRKHTCHAHQHHQHYHLQQQQQNRQLASNNNLGNTFEQKAIDWQALVSSSQHKVHPAAGSKAPTQPTERFGDESSKQFGCLIGELPPPAKFLDDSPKNQTPEVDGKGVEKQPVNRSVLVVDTATSPIEFSSSPKSEEDFREDCETRIMATGEKFTFESNDPRTLTLFGKEKEISQKLARHGHHMSHPNCRHCRQQSATCRPSSRGSHETNGNGNRCCSAAILAHDADCRLCNPRSELSQHRKFSPRSTRGCPDCARASSKSQSPRSRAIAKREEVKTDGANEIEAKTSINITNEDAKLPILSALQPKSSNMTANDLENLSVVDYTALKQQQSVDSDRSIWTRQSSRGSTSQPEGSASAVNGKSSKKAKKFSQKLTFSDILVERSSQQTMVTSYQQSQGNISAGDFYGNKEAQQHPILALNDSMTFSGGNTNQNAGQRGARNSTTAERLMNAISSSLSWLGQVSHLGSQQQTPSGGPDEEPKSSGSFLRSFLWRDSGNGSRHTSSSRGSSGGLLSPASKRFSSNDSSSNKNSSTEDSETTAVHYKGGYQPRGSGTANQASNQNSFNSTNSKPSYSSHHPIQPKSERKAAKTLSTLLLVFIVTWLPYNILVLIKTLSGDESQVPEKVWNFSYYLCYINSTINPLCYALCNAQFRRTYMRILKCKLSNEHNSTRRLVPIQSSTWNKDLRVNSDTCSNNNNQPTTSSTQSNSGNNHGSRYHR